MFGHRHYSAAIVLLGWWDPWIAILRKRDEGEWTC